MSPAHAIQVELDAPVIAQTLHGYDQGHRLLARGGDVNDAELALLDRLSDLSGYVPLGTEFDAYHTGFPCGRYYAFACTWSDVAATRAGTVLTHTLLIPLNSLGSVHDLWSLSVGHRRPESALDRAAYLAPAAIDLERLESLPPPVPASERALAAIILWFGQADRPVLWVEDHRPDDVTRFLWGLLWPEARKQFSFCTFALQARYVRRKLFGFLALPTAARGSFHERARSAAWWREGELASAALQKRSSQSWVQAIFERGSEATWTMPIFCEINGLPLLEATDFSVFQRFMDLEDSAHVRLTAARARADLLMRLWPAMDVAHPLLKTTLRQLLLLQEDAPLTPRPFWELSDFLERPTVSALADVDLDFAAEITATFASEVRRRIAEVDSGVIGAFTLLLAQAQHPQLRMMLLDVVQSAFATMPRDKALDAKATALLIGSVEALQPDLVHRILLALPGERRVRVALAALDTTTENARSTLTDFVLTAAQQLGDPMLAAEVWIAQGRPLDALRAASRLSFSGPRSQNFHPKSLERIVAQLDATARLTWALEPADPALAAWAGERGAEAIEELKLPLPDLLDRCLPAPNGANVLRAHVAKLKPHEVRYALNGARGVRFGLLELALRHTTSWADQLIEMAVETLRDDDLLSQEVATILTTAPMTSSGERYVERLVPRLVGWLAKARLEPHEVARWLGIGQVRQTIARLPQWTLFSKTRDSDEDCLPNLAHAIAAFLPSDPSTVASWITSLLARPLANAGSRGLERAAPDLVSILSLFWERDGWLELSATALEATRRIEFSGGYRVVEQTFPVLYAKLAKNELAPVPLKILTSWGLGWDVAKRWRHWLLDQWIDRGWPPASFLRCLGDDEELLRRIAHRAGRNWRGTDFLKTLAGAAAGDTQLAERWTAPLRRILGNSGAAGDYD